MKPIVIYTMPRTKGTAALFAAKRDTKLNEPIEILQLANRQISQLKSLFETRVENQTTTDWNQLQQQLSNPNTASKFFGSGLQQFYPARKWFNEISVSNDYDLYILLRNPRETLWSLLIALHYGFNELDTGSSSKYTEITDGDLFKTDLVLDNFLRFYPTNGTVVTFDILPKEHFDYDLIPTRKQDSINKMPLITNKDYVESNLDLILKFYQKEWEDKTGTDIFTFGLDKK